MTHCSAHAGLLPVRAVRPLPVVSRRRPRALSRRRAGGAEPRRRPRGVVVLRADNVFRFDGLSFAAAAVATDAVATPWPGAPGPPRAPQWRAGPDRRRRRPRTQRGAGRPQRRSCGCGRRPRRHAREKARAIGAEVAVAPDEVASVVAWSDGGADLGLEASGRPCGFDSLAASRSFRRQDRLLRVCTRLVVAARLDAPRALGARGDRITGELT